MTLRLILTRHAKSSWDSPAATDHDRPLNKRGEVSARAIGGWLAENAYTPGEALVSTSTRTRQTWDLIADAFDPVPEARFLDTLYHGEPDALLAAVRGAQTSSVMLIAHNPGIAYFAQGLVTELPGDARFERYPTCATAVIDFDGSDWGGVTWKTGRVADLVFPRDLI